jgi:hypothetical protein
MVNVTFKYGTDGTIERSFNEGTTVEQALRAGIRAGLGIPESVSVVVDGITKDTSYILQDCDEVVFETAPAQKA